MVPKAGECENLLVPVCPAPTHKAYSSIRMEPVFMILGLSAATAAVFALDDRVPVQKVTDEELRARLFAVNKSSNDNMRAPTARRAAGSSIPNRNSAPRPCLARRLQNSGARQEISRES